MFYVNLGNSPSSGRMERHEAVQAALTGMVNTASWTARLAKRWLQEFVQLLLDGHAVNAGLHFALGPRRFNDRNGRLNYVYAGGGDGDVIPCELRLR
jgi:hypothetical protein